ncbi:ATP-binding cassette domain-containing protein [Acidovorax sp. SUPP950]|uniref:ABC transporter transmembrane domain-containing protein n=1 Tax=unclassified Acidovorax TaxID=2684926 RepID=UPI00234AE280|nr:MULTISPECIES: ABC transporter transmembrane domain-containing protein [Comamonadaceae]WCM99089.1 ABC transporter transmembrane domain-containing protein [Acidovorax sp. GBBC 1281]WOI47607.1 ABC transporter transmembrane domain-containing protein [Paracidovorax avenae]GKS75775.1 ATP-binding cassette domain-containing protein [Acidovorax sp. SUPP950]GKT13621.1 ATP-binding cassette domain-containing protein [Acidovorax sp. SUPP2522]
MPSSSPTPGAPRSLGGLLPFLRPYAGRIALALVFLVLAALATLAFPLALRELIDGGLVGATRGEQAMALREHFGLLFAVAVALGLFSAARFYTVSWLGERVTADLRNAVYAHVLEQSPQFYETTQTGEVLSRLTVDTTLVQTVVGSSLSMGLRNAVMGVGALGMLVWTNPYIMSVVFAAIVVVVLPTLWIGRWVRRLSRASQDRVADSSAIAAEVLNAVPAVQSYTAESREARRFEASTENAFQTAVRRSRARAALVAFIVIANAALLLWGLYRGTQAVLAGEMSAGHLGQTVIYVMFLAGAVAVLGEVYGDLLRAAGATERLMELLASRSPIASPAQPAALPDTGGGLRVDFDRVAFHYPSRPQAPALRGFDLHLSAGETVALVGASGAGKTTVFQLLQRFYDVDAAGGGIALNGVDIRRLALGDLRAHVGIVPQDAVIFSASALDNIRYGRPGATEQEVQEAARAAFAHEFIAALPEGYGTFLGERGVRLSGGQRQRIAIARALLKNPPLLLLDEATSALDAESERMVQAALDAAMQRHSGQRTTLVIAHRLATVQNADRIVVMDQGQIVEEGRHADLVRQGGVYARLAALQFTQ